MSVEFPNRMKREEYEREYPIPDTFENLSLDENYTQHNWDEGHHRISRDKDGRPVRWCVTCHVPLVMGWYCGAPTNKKKHPPCRHIVYEEGIRCATHNTPEKLAAIAARRKEKKELTPEQREKKKERQRAKYRKKKEKQGGQVRQHYYPKTRNPPTEREHSASTSKSSEHFTSTSQVRQIEWVKVDRTKPDAEVKRRTSLEMRRGRVGHW